MVRENIAFDEFKQKHQVNVSPYSSLRHNILFLVKEQNPLHRELMSWRDT